MTYIELPNINARVEVVLPSGEAHSSRVEDVEGLVLTIAAPFRSAGGVLGGAVRLRWTGERGVYSAPGVLVEAVHDRIRSWTIRLSGEVSYFSRRRGARAVSCEPVRLLDAEDGREILQGHLVDISERGIRCRGRADELEAGSTVMVEMGLDGHLLLVRGSLLMVAEREVAEKVTAIVTLAPKESEATLIRKYVMDAQIRARRVMRGALH